MDDSLKATNPECRISHGSVWSFCGDVKIGEWGVGPEGQEAARNNCNHASGNGRWETCGKLFETHQDLREGKNMNIGEWGAKNRMV